MDDLRIVIPKIVERMKGYRMLYEQNEMATRNQVVDPVLRSLGWDPEDPTRVRPNVSMDEGVPDYTLFLDDKKVLFVEAKKMSVDIEDRQVLGQLAKYCVASHHSGPSAVSPIRTHLSRSVLSV